MRARDLTIDSAVGKWLVQTLGPNDDERDGWWTIDQVFDSVGDAYRERDIRAEVDPESTWKVVSAG